ncbi:MAG: hypothetical protein IJD81_02130, partial [Oscillospiraceae bacterium]|nr:hypothetical protein [Oscillospiraceae bacterium]
MRQNFKGTDAAFVCARMRMDAFCANYNSNYNSNSSSNHSSNSNSGSNSKKHLRPFFQTQVFI